MARREPPTSHALGSEAVAMIITQCRAGVWTITAAARAYGISLSHVSRILSGHKRQSVMMMIDPSSCAPTYQAPPRAVCCPRCDTPTHWVSYEHHVTRTGYVETYCPRCGYRPLG